MVTYLRFLKDRVEDLLYILLLQTILLDSFQISKMDDTQTVGQFRKHSNNNSKSLSQSKISAPSTPSKGVNFNDNPETEKHREKYLTAKYGAHQMALIRKRLKVEMWMFDQLQELQDSGVRYNI